MKFDFKTLSIAGLVIAGLAFGGYKMMFSSACCAAPTSEATSGCTPSNCRGATTKFGEAKVITDLRTDLIALKADMEQSENPVFDEDSYDIHGIVGESDDESLEIIVKQVQQVEDAFAETLNHQSGEFALPENKAKQIQYLSSRIEVLQELL